MTYPSPAQLTAAILDLYDRGEYPSAGAVAHFLRTQIDEAAFYRARRKLVRDGIIDLSTIEPPENQFGRAAR